MTDRDPRYFDDADEGTTPARRSRPGRRRRALMGEVEAKLGGRAKASPTGVSADKILERREQAEKARRLLEGGKNKGEQKGYGATANPERHQ